MFISCIALLALSSIAFAADPPLSSCRGKPNTRPVITTPPQLVNTVKNGALYQVKTGDDLPPLLIAHLYGSAYEMGYAQGQLLKSEIAATSKGFYQFVTEQIDTFLPHWSKPLQDIINKFGVGALDLALDLEIAATYEYTPQRFLDEMKGVAAGSGLSANEVHRISMFPELVKAGCSMFGAWGSASKDGSLVQLRALDWATNTPFQKHPVLLVYHPTEADSKVFSVLTWPGLLGAITGLNNAPLGVCEKVWLHFKGQDARMGTPWNFVLRDVLQFDATNDAAIARIKNAHRTCSIFAGVGSRASGTFDAMEYSYPKVTVWNAHTQPVYENHPNITDVVWVDKHTQPDTHDPCLADLLEHFHGEIDADTILHNITAQFETGDMHIAIYSYSSPLTMHVANAAPVNGEGVALPAYTQPFVKLNMDAEFARQN